LTKNARKTIFTFSFPVTLNFDLYTSDSLACTLVQRYVFTKSDVFLWLSSFQNTGSTALTDGQTDGQTDGV